MRVSQRSGERRSSNSTRPAGVPSPLRAAAFSSPAIARRQLRQYAIPFISSQLGGNPATDPRMDLVTTPQRAQVQSDPVTNRPDLGPLRWNRTRERVQAFER